MKLIDRVLKCLPYWPRLYWHLRGGMRYQKRHVEGAEYAETMKRQWTFLRKMLDNMRPDRIIDFGCGTGKFFPAYTQQASSRHLATVIGYYDPSPAMMEVATERAKSAARSASGSVALLNVPWFVPMPTVPIENADLVICAEVLLHVPPAKIETVLSEVRDLMQSWLSYAIFIVPLSFEETRPHCFNHDYDVLLPRCGFRIAESLSEEHPDIGQRFIVARPCPRLGDS